MGSVLSPTRVTLDISRLKGQGKQAFVVINFPQCTQYATLPHWKRALPGGVPETTHKLSSEGVEVLVKHD